MRTAVQSNKMLQEQLRATDDTESFMQLLVRFAEESGYSFNQKQLKEDLQEQEQIPLRNIETTTIREIMTDFRGGQNVW